MSKAKVQKTKTGKRNRSTHIFPALLFFIITSSGLYPLSYDRPAAETSITISADADQTKIPLNRVLNLKVTLAWTGDAGTFTILSFNDPVLTNLEITGTSTSNRTEAIEQGTRVIREYVYSLKPENLGMAYIESVSIKVHNNLDDTDETLQTRRIPVEVVDPVAETEKEWNWILLLVTLLVAAAIASLTLFYIRKKKTQKKSPPPEIQEPTEIQYLDELRKTWDLDNLNLQEDFSTLSRLLRRFLTEKFKVRAMEATTDELVEELQLTDIHENQIQSIKEILSRTDEIKFSGTKGNREEFTRFFTLIEGMLETFLRKPKKTIQKSDINQDEETQ